MSERAPRSCSEDEAGQEMLRRGRGLYDAIRPLFDVSNNLGLTVQYYARILERPHLADRLITAQFQPTKVDMIQPVPEVSQGFGSSVVPLDIILFSPNPNGNVIPNGIRIFLGKNSQYPVGLQPNGDIDPTVAPDRRESEISRTHSTFSLVARLIETGRLQPSDDFEKEIAEREKRLTPWDPNFTERAGKMSYEPVFRTPQEKTDYELRLHTEATALDIDARSHETGEPEFSEIDVILFPQPVEDEIISGGESARIEGFQDVIILHDESDTNISEITIRHRDGARNPLEWIRGAIKDIKESVQNR